MLMLDITQVMRIWQTMGQNIIQQRTTLRYDRTIKHSDQSPQFLKCSSPPRTLRGCVGTPSDYSRWDSPLALLESRVPRGMPTATAANVIHVLAELATSIDTMVTAATRITHKLI